MKILWSLVAVAVLLGGYILFVDRDRPSTDERRASRVRLVPRFEAASIRKITIVRRPGTSEEERSTLIRQPPGQDPTWQVARAGAAARPADDGAVTDLLTAIDLAEVERTADVTAAAAGLEPPAVRLELESAAGSVALALGKPDAAGQGVFARVAGDPAIRVGPRRPLELADRDPSAFRERRLVAARPDEVTSIAWDDGSGRRELRLVEGRWRNDRGEPAAGERVKEALQRILSLRAARFVELAAEAGGEEGGRRLQVTASKSTELVFSKDFSQRGLVRRADEGAVVQAPEAVAALWAALRAAAARDERVVSNPPESVTRVELSDDTRRLVLRRAGGAWLIGPPKVDYEADRQVVEEWLAALHGARPALGPVRPGARHLVVEGRYREAIDVSTPQEIFAQLEPDPGRFRDRRVLSFARLDVHRLSRRTSGATVEAIRGEGGTWQVAPRAAGAPDAAAIARVIGALADLRATTFDARLPRTAPDLTLEVQVLPPGEKTPRRHVLELYGGSPKGCPARLDGATTFTLPPETCDALRGPLAVPPSTRL